MALEEMFVRTSERTCRVVGCIEPPAPFRKTDMSPRGGSFTLQMRAASNKRAVMRRQQPRYCVRHLRLHWRMRHFGMTLDDYMQMYKSQKGRCFICRTKALAAGHPGVRSGSVDYLCIDHCHSSGKVRGLLCWDCNMGLGKFKDNPSALRKAADYLER